MKDGKSLVPEGENRYHAILGNGGPAYFVSASSLGPALVALGSSASKLLRCSHYVAESSHRAQRHADVRSEPSASPSEPFLPERLRRKPTDPINPRTGRHPTD